MKITVDEKVCLRHKLTLAETLLALAFRETTIDDIQNMLNRDIVVHKNDQYVLAKNWNDILDEILCESSDSIDDEERLLNLAKKMRECFPEGRMPGTAYYYRCNNREVVLKLKKFFTQYGNYPDDKIIDATKRFVASFQGNYRYLPLIKYFISKNKLIMDEDGQNHVSEVSELASYLENNTDKEQTSNDDWLMNPKN
jgi:hypothetical protein